MQAVSFSIRRVNRLRRAAAKARMVPAAEDPDLSPEESLSDGWFASAYDPSDLMRVFDTLWLKAGFTLHAYEFRAGSNGNGIIWAVPADATLVTPGDCPRLDDTWLQPPQPPGAVRLMQAIEGDGSSWSYLSVSNSSSGRRWKLDHAPAVGDPTHMVEFGTGRRAFAREA